MITEKEIIKILCKHYDFKKDVWCKRLTVTIDGFATIAKKIIERVKEE